MAQRPDNKIRSAKDAFSRGLSAHRKGRLDEALSYYIKSIALNPQAADAYNNMGVALRKKGLLHAAIASYRRAIQINPEDAGAHSNFGNALRAVGNYQAAEAAHRLAIELDSNYTDGLYNLGLALKDQGRLEEAVHFLCEAVQKKENYAEAHWDLSLTWLTMGNFEKGFREYEWRWHLPHVSPRIFDAPAWEGGEINGQTILLHAEQGMGDSIQFVRYVSLVSQRGTSIILECQKPLVSLFETLEEGLIVVPRDDNVPLPPFDCHAPLLSLPHIFQTTLETIPSGDSYLKPNKVLKRKFQKLMSEDSLNIGIAWAGKPTHKNDQNRSAGLEPFIELFGNNKFAFHSLQVGPRSNDILSKGCQGLLHDYSHILSDFADTAALISNLDLVISVDTSVCHLSGALGVPCWVILPHTCDWRWMMYRGDSPWYSSIRLFRQKHFGDWKNVFDNISKALMEKVDDGEKSTS